MKVFKDVMEISTVVIEQLNQIQSTKIAKTINEKKIYK